MSRQLASLAASRGDGGTHRYGRSRRAGSAPIRVPSTAARSAGRTVPLSGLTAATLALAAAVASLIAWPLGVTARPGLFWILPLVPLFLLLYHKNRVVPAAGLAAGMVALVGVDLASLLLGDWSGAAGAQVAEAILIPGSGRAIGELLRQLLPAGVATGLIGMTFRASLREPVPHGADPVTGMPGRALLDQSLELHFARAERGGSLAVCVFGLERIYGAGQSAGRATDRAALRAFAATLDRQTRLSDLSGRRAGDRFVALLPGGDESSAYHFVSRIERKLAHGPAAGSGLLMSAGIAAWDPRARSPRALLLAAEEALQRARLRGGVPAVGVKDWSREPLPARTDPKSARRTRPTLRRPAAGLERPAAANRAEPTPAPNETAGPPARAPKAPLPARPDAEPGQIAARDSGAARPKAPPPIRPAAEPGQIAARDSGAARPKAGGADRPSASRVIAPTPSRRQETTHRTPAHRRRRRPRKRRESVQRVPLLAPDSARAAVYTGPGRTGTGRTSPRTNLWSSARAGLSTRAARLGAGVSAGLRKIVQNLGGGARRLVTSVTSSASAVRSSATSMTRPGWTRLPARSLMSGERAPGARRAEGPLTLIPVAPVSRHMIDGEPEAIATRPNVPLPRPEADSAGEPREAEAGGADGLTGKAVAPTERGVIPPEQAAATSVEVNAATPPEETAAAPPEETAATPPEETAAAPPEATAAAPPEEAAATPPEETVVTPPEETVPPEESAARAEADIEADMQGEDDSESTGADSPVPDPLTERLEWLRARLAAMRQEATALRPGPGQSITPGADASGKPVGSSSAAAEDAPTTEDSSPLRPDPAERPPAGAPSWTRRLRALAAEQDLRPPGLRTESRDVGANDNTSGSEQRQDAGKPSAGDPAEEERLIRERLASLEEALRAARARLGG